MIRSVMTFIGFMLLAGCRAEPRQTGARAAADVRTASPYSTGPDSGAAHQRIEGTNTGVEFEAPRRIPGVFAALAQVARQPDRANITALRGDLGSLEDAMRDDFRRVGVADTGAFAALTDSLAYTLGGGPGGLAKALDPKEIGKVEAWVRRLVDEYNERMSRVRR